MWLGLAKGRKLQQQALQKNLIPIPKAEVGRDLLVVFGAWCGLTASLGIYNTSGVFEVVISQVILPQDSASTLGWLFSTYAFVNWIFGVRVGPTFDTISRRPLIAAGIYVL